MQTMLINNCFNKITSFALCFFIINMVAFGIDVDENNANKGTSKKVYVENSLLSTGTWYKVEVGEAGIYQLNASILSQLDITVENINNIKIYVGAGSMLPEANSKPNFDDMVETHVKVIDDNFNNRFDANDAILFYAPGLDKWVFNEMENRYQYQQHLYALNNYVFINVDGAVSEKIGILGNNIGAATYTTNTFDLLQVHETERYNLVEHGSGRQWYGELFGFENEYSFNFDLKGLITSEPVDVTTAVAIRSFEGDGNLQVQANNNALHKHNVSSVSPEPNREFAKASTLTNTLMLNNTNLNLQLEYFQKNGSEQAWLDYIEINGRANLAFNNFGDQLIFSDKKTRNEKIVDYTITGNADVMVWDITNSNHPIEMVIKNGSFTNYGGGLKTYVAFNNSTLKTPLNAEAIANQNLHQNAAYDYLIISHPNFIEEAQRLAEFHKNNNNLTVLITTPQEIYNEFSNGITDITAIRNFIRMFYHRAYGNENLQPKFVLLFGDASYDFKNLHLKEENNESFVPTFQSYESLHSTSTFCTDDYFVLLDEDEGNKVNSRGYPDAAIGRIPCHTLEQAKNYVDKVLHYKNTNTFGSWQNKYTLLADDEDGDLHFRDSESHAKRINDLDPCTNLEKLYLDAYEQESTTAGGRYPQVNEALNRTINEGTFVVNYVGHGGEKGFAHERVLQFNDIDSWDNFDNMPLFVTATCSFSRFDNPDIYSAGEHVILRPEGGAIANVTTTRVVYASQNRDLNGEFISNFFLQKEQRQNAIGTTLMLAKAAASISANVRKFALLGDPALHLNFPKYKVITNTINGKAISFLPDTLTALSTVTISGEIQDLQNRKMENFNGTLFPTIFDKALETYTLGNDEKSSVKEFYKRDNIIFNGQSQIKNGQFQFSFVVPKDVKLFYDMGKISYYALSEDGIDANGCHQNIVIGGIAENAFADNTPPAIQLFMINEDFRFGGITNENPDLLVKLFDESGINTVGGGIGHNITCILDDNDANAIVLNDFYKAETNNYKSGSLVYPFNNLTEGKHTLRIRAFDVHNNWSEAYLEFEVQLQNNAVINSLSNHPNPFSNETNFSFEHNQSGSNLMAQIDVYNLTGQKIRSIQQNISGNGFKVTNIKWTGEDDQNYPIASGTYVYRVSINNGDQTFLSDFQKLMFLR